MEWGRSSSSSSSSRKMLIEQAKEELEKLEYEQPNKFKSLKQDLRAFISELESQDLPTVTMFAETQESSSSSSSSTSATKKRKRRSNTDAVLERAQQCLHKIRHLKTSFS